MGRFFGIFICCIFLTQAIGCASHVPSSTTQLAQIGPAWTATMHPTIEELLITPSPTVLSPNQTTTRISTPTLRSSSTPVPNQLISTIPACAHDGQLIEFPSTDGVDGAILYRLIGDTNLSIIGGTPLRKTHLSITSSDLIENFGVSPNGNWLAFSNLPERNEQASTFEPEIFLVSSSGDVINTKIDMSRYQSKLSGDQFIDYWKGEWFNNKFLKIDIFARIRGGQNAYHLASNLIEPFTSEWQEYPSDKLEDDHYIWSPDQSKGFSREESKSMNQYFITYGKEIRNQAKIEMTRLQNENGNLDLELGQVSWSPDSRFLLLVFLYFEKGSDKQTNRIFVYDTEDNSYIFQCNFPRIGIPESWVNYPLNIVWSPKSNAFIANVVIVPHTFLNPNVLLFNIKDHEVYQFLPGANALGWSREFLPLLKIKR